MWCGLLTSEALPTELFSSCVGKYILEAVLSLRLREKKKMKFSCGPIFEFRQNLQLLFSWLLFRWRFFDSIAAAASRILLLEHVRRLSSWIHIVDGFKCQFSAANIATFQQHLSIFLLLLLIAIWTRRGTDSSRLQFQFKFRHQTCRKDSNLSKVYWPLPMSRDVNVATERAPDPCPLSFPFALEPAPGSWRPIWWFAH